MDPWTEDRAQSDNFGADVIFLNSDPLVVRLARGAGHPFPESASGHFGGGVNILIIFPYFVQKLANNLPSYVFHSVNAPRVFHSALRTYFIARETQKFGTVLSRVILGKSRGFCNWMYVNSLVSGWHFLVGYCTYYAIGD